MKHMYIAIDGTQFENENECKVYENQLIVRHGLQYLCKNIKVFDSTCKPIDIQQGIVNIYDIYYINAKNATQEEMDSFVAFYQSQSDNDDNIPKTPNIWRWNDEAEEWVTYEDEKQVFDSWWPSHILE